MIATPLILVRHGETDWNKEHRWQGHADQPLNDTGRAQARELAEALAGREIGAVYASDLVRARETAELIAARLGLPVSLDAGLREVDVGDWAGRLLSEIEHDNPDAFRRWQDGRQGWRGGESYDEMGERVVAAVLRIADRHPGETVLVVTHGGSIRACRAAAAGLTYAESRATGIVSTANCELVELQVAAGRLTGPPR
ncbi:MAG TPA: histidine phosphatase family protein [Gaiellaceae bacterium]